MKKTTKKAWSGRFNAKESPLMERFNASIHVDKRLYQQDIAGSIAHARMLVKIGVLTATEFTQIETGLLKIRAEIDAGKFIFSAAQEDIHMAIESRLTELIGALGGKLHTARSRNDQVALDSRLYVREQTQITLELLRSLQKILVALAQKNTGTILPGYTHLQRAQPILLAHHLLAYFEMLARDYSRFADNLKRLNQCPLGAGALAGSPVAIDRNGIAKELGFDDVTHNSLDTVSDRDFILDFLTAAAILMMHLSRLAEELVLWSSQEFDFVKLPEGFSTGSSMMPQKINPDAPELIRGKTGRIYGNLMGLLTTMKALPLSYNKDMQEDKEPLFDSVDTISDCLNILIAMLPSVTFNTEKMFAATRAGFLLATDLADYLAKKGLPFRQAHEVVGKLVRVAIDRHCGLEDLDLALLKKHCGFFDVDVKSTLSIKSSVNARKSIGGTATECVKKEIARAKQILTGRKNH